MCFFRQIGPLRRLQNASGYSRTQRGIASAMLDGMTDALTQRNVTRSHLEHQVVAAITLKSPVEYLYWYECVQRARVAIARRPLTCSLWLYTHTGSKRTCDSWRRMRTWTASTTSAQT